MNFRFQHFVAASAAKVSADMFVQLILHPAFGLITKNANVGRGLRDHDGVIGTRAPFLKALEE